MKILLSQLTSAGRISVGRSPEGCFHVLWNGDSVAVAESLGDALKAACGRSWVSKIAGRGRASVQVSTLAEDWVLAH